LAVIAVILSGIGLNAALVYSVTRRRRELGIRIAIGAQDRHIVQTICGRAIVAVGIGPAVGVAVSTALLGFTRSLLYGVSPDDPKTLLSTVCGVLLCSLSAVAFPTWRAMRTNPVMSLRENRRLHLPSRATPARADLTVSKHRMAAAGEMLRTIPCNARVVSMLPLSLAT
jgi:ABC-type antimicrobial peptide transport system permease subunit